jgi:hypothetical protein
VVSSEPTIHEVAETFTRVLERPVLYQRIPRDQFQKQAGDEMAQMYQWFEAVGYHVDFGELWQRFGDLTDLESYLRQHGWGAASAAASIPHSVTA